MRITSTLLTRLGQLTKLGEPEPTDTQVVIPSALMEPAPYPCPFPSNLLATYSDSFTAALQSTITNTPGGAALGFMTLVPGLWSITFALLSQFNWLNANPIAQDNRLVLTQNIINNIEIWSQSAIVATNILVLPPRKFFLDQPSVVRLIQNGNGAGQTSTFQVNIHAERYL